jgi:endogenous inhibitor of DNA gyrase (YacG/DUF329 family)
MTTIKICNICGVKIDLGGEYSAPWHNLSITTRYTSNQEFIEHADFCSVKCAKIYLDNWLYGIYQDNRGSSKGKDIRKTESIMT